MNEQAIEIPPTDHPILASLAPVVANCRHVALNLEKVEEVAGWMAYEELPWPDFRTPMLPDGDERAVMDFIFLTAAINFAFTDFETCEVFRVYYDGAWRYDSDAMMACLKRAGDAGIPILEGQWLAQVDRGEMEKLFAGPTPIPLLEKRLTIFHELGQALETRWGSFHRFFESGPTRVYSDGEGLLGRLVKEFPSFQDASMQGSRRLLFHKRAQLLLWQLHARFRQSGFFRLEDPEALTALADYIVPAALRLLGVLSYEPALEDAIQRRQLIAADSLQEIEIRACTIWACRLMTEAINQRRPSDKRIIDTVLDARLWTHYHTTHWPHHLTATTDY